MQKEEKRRHDRYDALLDCKIGLSNGKIVQGKVVNLSAEGMKIVFPKEVNHGRFFLFEGDVVYFLITGEKRPKGKGMVKWIKQNEENFECGIELLEVDKENFVPVLFSAAFYSMDNTRSR